MDKESVRKLGIEKWEAGLEACTDASEFFDWWLGYGVVYCKHCVFYNCYSYNKIKITPPTCPLWVEGVSKVCAPEWDELYKLDKLADRFDFNVDMDIVKGLVTALIERIKNY